MQIFWVIPFFKLQNNTWTTVKWWKMRWRKLTSFQLSCFVVLMSSTWKDIGMTLRCNFSFHLVSCQGFESSVLVKLSSTVVRAHLQDLSIQDCSVGAIYPKVNSNTHFSPFAGCLCVSQRENDLNRSGSCSEMLQAANCIRNVRNFEDVLLLVFMYLVFTRIPGESYRWWFNWVFVVVFV